MISCVGMLRSHCNAQIEDVPCRPNRENGFSIISSRLTQMIVADVTVASDCPNIK